MPGRKKKTKHQPSDQVAMVRHRIVDAVTAKMKVLWVQRVKEPVTYPYPENELTIVLNARPANKRNLSQFERRYLDWQWNA